MVDLLYFCAPSPGSFVLLREFMLILLGFPLNLADILLDPCLGQLWVCCQVMGTSWKPSFWLNVCMLGSRRTTLGMPRSLLMHLTGSSINLHLAGTKMWLIGT